MAQSKPLTSYDVINNIPISHIPDRQINFDSEHFLCSSAGQFSEERLAFFAKTIYPYWAHSRCTLHQLADYLEPFGITLWTANDVRTEGKMEFAFEFKFTQQYKGSMLLQCELSHKESVH